MPSLRIHYYPSYDIVPGFWDANVLIYHGRAIHAQNLDLDNFNQF